MIPAHAAGAQKYLMGCVALNLTWLSKSDSMDTRISVIYLLKKIHLIIYVCLHLSPERKHICLLASRPTVLFWQRTGCGWRGTGRTAGASWPDVWGAHLYLPTQDSNSKEALAMTVLVLVPALSKKY